MNFGVFYEIQLPAPHDPADETRAFRQELEHAELADRLGIYELEGTSSATVGARVLGPGGAR